MKKYYAQYGCNSGICLNIFVDVGTNNVDENFWRMSDIPNINSPTRYKKVPDYLKDCEITQEEANRICKAWYNNIEESSL